MTTGLEQRRALVDYLQRHPLVEDVDFSRDGYRTVVLELGDEPRLPELEECVVCGAVGLPERIEDHDCREFKAREKQPRQE